VNEMKLMKNHRIIIYVIVIVALILGSAYMYKSGQISKIIGKEQLRCSTNADCACGVNLITGDCFVGNENFVNTKEQCPDFCNGIGGNFQVKCAESKCTLININH
jgi:hypothetical protein